MLLQRNNYLYDNFSTDLHRRPQRQQPRLRGQELRLQRDRKFSARRHLGLSPGSGRGQRQERGDRVPASNPDQEVHHRSFFR